MIVTQLIIECALLHDSIEISHQLKTVNGKQTCKSRKESIITAAVRVDLHARRRAEINQYLGPTFDGVFFFPASLGFDRQGGCHTNYVRDKGEEGRAKGGGGGGKRN